MVERPSPFSKQVLPLRHRLRFLLQELDLPPGETLIGRSSDCLITLEDPLVSRRHARLLIQGSEAVFEDLGSRNGSRVNGYKVHAPVRLEEGDRIRIGALELVYCTLPGSPLVTRLSTGQLRNCSGCPAAFPEEVIACPNCGASAELAMELEETSTDVQYDWALYLLTGFSVDALSQGQTEVAERLLRVGLSSVDAQLATGYAPQAAQLDALLEALLMLMGKGGGTVALLQRTLAIYARRAQAPSSAMMHAIASLAAESIVPLASVIDEIVKAARSRGSALCSKETEALEVLESLRGDFEKWRRQ